MVNLKKCNLLKLTTLQLIITTIYHCQNCIITLDSF